MELMRLNRYTSSTVIFACFILSSPLNALVTTTSPNSQHAHFPPRQQSDIQKMTRVEIEGYTIGDEHRSETSSASFFSSIDRDGDGTLRRPELSSFIRDKIGGDPFDTQEEREREIESVLTRLDLNANGLDELDVMSYWKKNLDGLLGVEDVADWLVHAVQLPHEDVESKFCRNHVTGYDFPELVENNGERLRTELGVENPRHVKKIMSLVNARMVGIESNLPKIELNTPEVSCTRVKLTWEKLETKSGFPVHKYRIQRLAVPMENGSSADLSIIPAEGSSTAATRGRRLCRDSNKPIDNWETIYDGMDNEYVDCNIEIGFDYTYRIEAWNALGKSPWVSVTPEHKWWRPKCQRKSGSSAKAAIPKPATTDSWSNFQFFMFFISFMKQIFYLMMMIIGYMWKLQVQNGSVSRNRYFTSIRDTINKLGRKIWDYDIIPKKIDKKKTADSIRIHGIAGSYPLLRDSFSLSPPTCATPNPSSRSQHKNNKNSYKKKKRPISAKNEEQATSDMFNISAITLPSEIEKEKNDDIPREGLQKEDSTSAMTRETDDSPRAGNDPKRCSICDKKFKIFRRRRHHCSICLRTFCGKHGKCNHPIGTPCPVRGCCVCNSCL